MRYSIVYTRGCVKRKIKKDKGAGMIRYLETLFEAMRPAFSRRATFAWFVVVFAGFVVRGDAYGVSSIVRALFLNPMGYPSLLNFFHSTAWSREALLSCWWEWLARHKAAHMVNGRIVMLGDHTKNLKDARKMPEVATLHQDSETASKPSFFRGHHWAAIAVLACAGKRVFALPAWAEIHRDAFEESRSTRIVALAARIAEEMKTDAYLVLDAFFAVGPVFLKAVQTSDRLHIITRAKNTAVAYLPAPKPKKKRRGRKRIYGEKIKLANLFDSAVGKFQTARANVYGKDEQVHCLALNLLWKPVKGTLRFVLIESSRGRIVIMTSDLTLDPAEALQLYCRRVPIETMFDALKNILGAMNYHFWSKYLPPISRRPLRNETDKPASSRPDKTQNTLEAIEKFVIIQLLVLGTLHLLATHFPARVQAQAHCWLRTPCGQIPSVFVARTALANLIRRNLFTLAKDSITQTIRRKQNKSENTRSFEDAA
jgi:hypothetical protein